MALDPEGTSTDEPMVVLAEPGRDLAECEEPDMTRMYFVNAPLFAFTILAAAGAANAQDADIQTTYATEKGACGRGPETRVEISEGRISGPGFDCTISGGRPAGSGLVAHEAACTVDGNQVSDGLVLDLGNYKDHFNLSIPGRKGWIALYPCTPVPGLD